MTIEEGEDEMTENEVVTYLKANRTKGTVFAFMPEEVRKWCMTHQNEPIFNIYGSYGWGSITTAINYCYYAGVYALPDDYKPEPEFKPHWEEFPINKDGMFFITSDDGKVHHHRWWDWITFLNRHRDNFDDFGGWVYETSLSNGEKIEVLTTSPHVFERGKDLSAFIILNGKNESKPAYPTKIFFWRYKE